MHGQIGVGRDQLLLTGVRCRLATGLQRELRSIEVSFVSNSCLERELETLKRNVPPRRLSCAVEVVARRVGEVVVALFPAVVAVAIAAVFGFELEPVQPAAVVAATATAPPAERRNHRRDTRRGCGRAVCIQSCILPHWHPIRGKRRRHPEDETCTIAS